jgi:hypothetical protein
VDPSSAYPARIYNYLLGGDDNFAADREAAQRLYGGLPGGVDTARAIARAAHAFINRAVRHLAGEAGIRQFLNLSSVVRVLDDVHDVAHQVAPDARVVYVTNDPVVLAHAHELPVNGPAGNVSFVLSDLRDLPALMRQVAGSLDLSQPVAVILQGLLQYLSGKADPHEFVTQLLEPVAPGSYLVVTHAASDIGDAQMVEVAKRQEQLTKAMRWPLVPRSGDEVTRFFDGLELVEPGVVAIDQWRPSAAAPSPSAAGPFPWYGAVGRKPG